MKKIIVIQLFFLLTNLYALYAIDNKMTIGFAVGHTGYPYESFSESLGYGITIGWEPRWDYMGLMFDFTYFKTSYSESYQRTTRDGNSNDIDIEIGLAVYLTETSNNFQHVFFPKFDFLIFDFMGVSFSSFGVGYRFEWYFHGNWGINFGISANLSPLNFNSSPSYQLSVKGGGIHGILGISYNAGRVKSIRLQREREQQEILRRQAERQAEERRQNELNETIRKYNISDTFWFSHLALGIKTPLVKDSVYWCYDTIGIIRDLGNNHFVAVAAQEPIRRDIEFIVRGNIELGEVVRGTAIMKYLGIMEVVTNAGFIRQVPYFEILGFMGE
jgi:hypothetical protein